MMNPKPKAKPKRYTPAQMADMKEWAQWEIESLENRKKDLQRIIDGTADAVELMFAHMEA